jgi:transcriptional regulator with XRE-family HTH domain
MESLAPLVRGMRRGVGLSQRELARLAATSQPAVARYERGAATPSWETLERLAAACGRRIQLRTEVLPDSHDIELAALLLDLTPQQRLRALPRYARLHAVASVQP